MRSIYCIVPGCRSNNIQHPDIGYFIVPRNADLLKLWVTTLNIPEVLGRPQTSTTHKYVCGLHFEDKCFQNHLKKKLNRGVVPTILHPVTGKGPSTSVSVVVEPIPGPSTLTVLGGSVLLENPISEPSSNVTVTEVTEPVPGPSTISTPAKDYAVLAANVTVAEICAPVPGPSKNVTPVKEFAVTAANVTITEVSDPGPSTISTPARDYAVPETSTTRGSSGKRTGRKAPYNILKMMGETHAANLTPKKKKLCGELLRTKHLLSTMKKRGCNVSLVTPPQQNCCAVPTVTDPDSCTTNSIKTLQYFPFQ